MFTQAWNQLMYPTALKKRVDGDWNCGKCNNLNFQFRTVCNRCHTHQEAAKGFNSALFLISTPIDIEYSQNQVDNIKLPEINSLLQEIKLKPEQAWQQKQFSHVNSKASTRSSSLNKEEQKEIKPQKNKTKIPPNSREGDWKCEQCGNINFAFRRECNLCRQNKTRVKI